MAAANDWQLTRKTEKSDRVADFTSLRVYHNGNVKGFYDRIQWVFQTVTHSLFLNWKHFKLERRKVLTQIQNIRF